MRTDTRLFRQLERSLAHLQHRNRVLRSLVPRNDGLLLPRAFVRASGDDSLAVSLNFRGQAVEIVRSADEPVAALLARLDKKLQKAKGKHRKAAKKQKGEEALALLQHALEAVAANASRPPSTRRPSPPRGAISDRWKIFREC